MATPTSPDASIAKSPPTGRFQTTLADSVRVHGVGMHSGNPTAVTLQPAQVGNGVTFHDDNHRSVIARADCVVNTRRCTSLAIGDRQISTVEHLLSALYGLEVDNVEIHVEGSEIPILDGSAESWVKAIQSAGIREERVPAETYSLKEPMALNLEETWIAAIPSDSLTITCVTHFEHPMLGTEVVTYEHTARTYAKEIAPARTFGFIEEVEALLAAGLAKGGSIENALIVYPDRFSLEQRLPNECNRHKLLDLIGDLSLTGSRFSAAITAIKPSHRANVEFAKLLSRRLTAQVCV